MDNDINAAVVHLIEMVNAPDGAFSVLPWTLSEPPKIRVFIDPMYRHIASSIPAEIDGYQVMVEPRPRTYTTQ